MIYLTQKRLMVESERTVRIRARKGDVIPKRVCGQLIADPIKYDLWRFKHSNSMLGVAERKKRDLQIVALRAVHLEQIHRTSLVRYLRKHGITGEARDMTLREFYGVMDSRRAAVTEHKIYLMSASSQLCAYDLLKMVGDQGGLALLQDYQGTYGQYFGMFCDRSRATRNQTAYILNSFIDDAKAEAEAIRQRLLGGDLLPATPVAVKQSLAARRLPVSHQGMGGWRAREDSNL